MRELKPLREAPASWPLWLMVAVGTAGAGAALWGVLTPGESGTPLPPALAALVVAGVVAAGGLGAWAFHVAPRRLDYRLRGRTLVITTLLGRRSVPLRAVERAEAVDFDLKVVPGIHLGWPRSHLPGYYVGRFPVSGLGGTRVVVAVRRGRGVVLRLSSGVAVLVAPKDPDALLRLVQARGGGRA